MSSGDKNIAYVDGQNLYLGTTKATKAWVIDLARFRVYLTEKYRVEVAYYYLGYVQEGATYDALYEHIQRAGFVLVFRQHNNSMVSKKKGNVDSDIIFSVMKRLAEGEKFNKLVLVSGDGDYRMLVDYMIEKGRFEKILFPNMKFRSSLYKAISNNYTACLDQPDIKRKIALKKEKGALGINRSDPFSY